MITLATRGSLLALVQANRVKRLLENLGESAELLIVRTRGDRALDLKLADNLDKGLFTSEIEAAVASGRADLAVHSLKDMPSEGDPRCSPPMIIEREAAEDLLIVSPPAVSQKAGLPLISGARVGTSAARRIALLKHYRPDLSALAIRGNVPTRLAKLKAGDVDALILARAGLHRLGSDLSNFRCFRLLPELWLPAPGQGAIGVQSRRDDHQLIAKIEAISTREDALGVVLERQALSLVEGSCHLAIGALAKVGSDGAWRLMLGLGGSPKGWQIAEVQGEFPSLAAETVAQISKAPLEPSQRCCFEPLNGVP